jgi:hypothetical protein
MQLYQIRHPSPSARWSFESVPQGRHRFTLVSWDRLGFGYFPGPAPDGRRYSFTFVPHWFFALVLAVVPLRRLYRAGRRARRATGGLCPRCGYDIRATPARCPECGDVPMAGKGAA